MSMRKHRATGKPVGRPPKFPTDMDFQILQAIREAVDPKTGLVKACWRTLGSRFHASRSTIARHLQSLRQRGLLESVTIKRAPGVVDTYYRPD